MIGAMNDGGFALATHGNAFISIWKEPSTLERLGVVRRSEQELTDRSPRGIVVLTVLLHSAYNVPPEVREEASRVARHFAATTRAHAYVIEGGGFRAAAMRAVIAGIVALSRM